jgi:hypothetical protein
MADEPNEFATWLPVIGKSLAYLCLAKATEADPERFRDVLAKVDFLEDIGVPTRDAAHAAGSTAASVQVMRSRSKDQESQWQESQQSARPETVTTPRV